MQDYECDHIDMVSYEQSLKGLMERQKGKFNKVSVVYEKWELSTEKVEVKTSTQNLSGFTEVC